MDIAGVALKGIQALELEVSELKKLNQKLEQKNKLLASKMEEINKKLDLLLQK
jgi:FtsZ-binding cell division protein ZapB